VNPSTSITLADGTTINNFEIFTNLRTGSGADTIAYTTRADDTVATNGGNDTINAGLGRDNVDGGADSDLLIIDYSSLREDTICEKNIND
jgi:Ca2+-binding RTX toxin-like protein